MQKTARKTHSMGPSPMAMGLSGGSGLYDSMDNPAHQKPGSGHGDPRFMRRAGSKKKKAKVKAKHKTKAKPAHGVDPEELGETQPDDETAETA